VLTDAEWETLRLSAQVAAWSIGLQLIPGIAIAWLLARRTFPGKPLVDAFIHLPLVLPPVVTGYLLLRLLGTRGVIGQWLHQLGFDVAFTWKGAVAAAAVMAFPLLVRSARLAIELSDRGLEDAARTLGATPWRVFLTITLPLAAPGILAGAVLSFARGLGEFGATITLAGNIAGQSRTLPVAIYSYSQVPNGDDQVARLVAIAIAISVLALCAAEWLNQRLAHRLGVRR
jgi:molybdate transport system permease protein